MLGRWEGVDSARAAVGRSTMPADSLELAVWWT